MTRRVSALVAAGIVGLAACAAACAADRPAPRAGGGVMSRIATILVADATRVTIAAYPTSSDITSVDGLPGVSESRFSLKGTWSVCDYTDRRCLLRRDLVSGYPDTQLWLADLAGRRLRRVFLRPVNAGRRFCVLEAKLSDRWVVWEEIASVDDLTTAADWRLYAARIGRDGMVSTHPRLIDGGSTRDKQRPHFDVAGDEVLWMVDQKAEGRDLGSVYALRLPHGKRRVVAQTLTTFHTLSAVGGRVLVTEPVSPRGLRLHCTVIDPLSGRRDPSFDLANPTPLVQFPAYGDRRLAWSLFRDPDEVATGTLYLRTRDGVVHLVSTHDAVHPVFVGDLLFYQTTESLTPGCPWGTVHALDTRTLDDACIAKSRYEQVGWWTIPSEPPSTSATVVVSQRRGWRTASVDDDVTVMKVFACGRLPARDSQRLVEKPRATKTIEVQVVQAAFGENAVVVSADAQAFVPPAGLDDPRLDDALDAASSPSPHERRRHVPVGVPRDADGGGSPVGRSDRSGVVGHGSFASHQCGARRHCGRHSPPRTSGQRE
jgi:hypothetical protein